MLRAGRTRDKGTRTFDATLLPFKGSQGEPEKRGYMPNNGTNGGTSQGDGSGTGSNNNGGTSQGDGSSMSRRARRRKGVDEIRSAGGFVDRMILRYGTLERAIEELGGELAASREEIQELTESNASLVARQIPKDGVVLTADEAAAWKKIQASGVPVDKVADRAKLADTLESEKVANERKAQRATVAKSSGYNADVLSPLLDQFGLDVEARTEKISKDGQVVDGVVAYVRKANDDKAAWEKLGEFVNKDGSPLKPFAVALQTSGGTTNQGNGSNGTNGTNGTAGDTGGGRSYEFPVMTGGDSGTGGGLDPAAEFLKQRNARMESIPNPLAPQKMTK